MEENYTLQYQKLLDGLSLPIHMTSCWANSEYFHNFDQNDGIVLKIEWDVNFIVHIRPSIVINDDGQHFVSFKVGCQPEKTELSQAPTTPTILPSQAYSIRNKMKLEDKFNLYENLCAKIITDPDTKRGIFDQADLGNKESSAWKCWMCLLIHVDLFGKPFKPLQRGIQHMFTNSNSVLEVPEMVHPYIPDIEEYPDMMNFKFSFCVAHMTERSLREIALENVAKLLLERPDLDLDIPQTLINEVKSKYERSHQLAKAYAGTNDKFYKNIFESAIKIL